MNNLTNSLQFKSLGAVAKNASPEVLNAIQTASSRTGVDFSYLVKQAAVESSFKTDAKNKHSSATGLYQFIDSTWMQMMDRYGDDFGIETDGKSKREILAMRKDPEAASFMAAAFASENEQTLRDNWGGDVGETELYLAHFMGANGASSFLRARDENPLRAAADLFPAAARANRNVFYDQQTGKPRSLEQVYNFFDRKFESQPVPEASKTQVAQKSVVSPEMTEELLAMTATNDSTFSRTALSDSVVMVRAQEMRAAREAQDGSYITSLGISPRIISTPAYKVMDDVEVRTPFLTRMANPVDVMAFAQQRDKWNEVG